jgi:outer membrane protein TolC
MKNKYFTLISSFLLSISSFGQLTEIITLEDAKAYALEHHTKVKNSIQDIEMARQQMIEVRGMGLPQINLTGSFSNFINLPVQVVDASFINPMAQPGETIEFKAGTDYTMNGTLNVNQLIFNGSYIVGLQVASYFNKFQQTATQISKEEVVFNVIQAYEMAAIAKLNLELADSIFLVSKKLVEKQTNYFELGLILKEDIDQLNYSLLMTQNNQLSAKVQYENSLNYLKLTMGYPIHDVIEINQTPDELLMKTANNSGDISRNLTLELMTKQVKLSEYNLKNKKYANLPSLNGYFQHAYNAYRNEFNFFSDEKWFPQTVWGLQLNVPIFSGLQRQAQTSQAKIKLLKDENSLEQLESSLKFQEVKFKNELIGAQSKFDLQIQNIELAKSIYENSIIKENIGKGNSIVVTQKQQQLMSAQAQYIGSLVELFQAKLNLDKLYNNLLPN